MADAAQGEALAAEFFENYAGAWGAFDQGLIDAATNDRNRLLIRLALAEMAGKPLNHVTVAEFQSVNPAFGGRLVYWSEPDGHVWEALTVSYARQGVTL